MADADVHPRHASARELHASRPLKQARRVGPRRQRRRERPVQPVAELRNRKADPPVSVQNVAPQAEFGIIPSME